MDTPGGAGDDVVGRADGDGVSFGPTAETSLVVTTNTTTATTTTATPTPVARHRAPLRAVRAHEPNGSDGATAGLTGAALGAGGVDVDRSGLTVRTGVDDADTCVVPAPDTTSSSAATSSDTVA